MAEPRTHSNDETLTLIRQKAAEQDEFAVKVLRRVHNSMAPTRIAMFSGATATHLVNPELWIPQLAGGGNFMLQAYHVSDLNKPVGGFVTFPVEGDPRDVDIAATVKTSWRGPAILDFPGGRFRSS